MNKILRAALALVLLLTAFIPSTAQKHDSDRRQWMAEMRQLRTNYVVHELKLTQEQRDKFVPLYDEMSREVTNVMTETRRLHKSVREKGQAASDLEKEKAAEAVYECKGRENAIEMRYFRKFKTILTPDQLLNLRSAEHRFNRQLMKQHKKDAKNKK